MRSSKSCVDCDRLDPVPDMGRRAFLRSVAAGAVALGSGAVIPAVAAPPTRQSAAEQAVKALYDTLTDMQKRAICFAWDYVQPAPVAPATGASRGLLRTHVSNNWQITGPTIDGNFYTREQKAIAFDIFKGIIHPDWHNRIQRQLRDDTGGRPWGAAQSMAIFGVPGTDQFEFVMTGRHMTIRCDGNSTPNVAFGGPIFYGHAASAFNERVGHPGNVFWEQAIKANFVYRMLDERQRNRALAPRRPGESAVAFRPAGDIPGLPVSEMTADQKAEMRRVLACLVEPYRQEDRDDVMACLDRQGGLDRCNLTFYRDGDLGDDGEWDNWRLEGPAFVWYYRGEPHVHCWVNIADDPSVRLNARG